MSNSVFSPNEDTDIDAEFMEKWLGGTKINDLNPKVLYDLQALLTHYKDIIVPMEDVKVSFPVEGEVGTACASVDDKKIYIPTGTLEKGRVDDTIGLVIHELNHIKHSEKETTIVKACSNFIMVVLDTIFVKTGNGDEYDSLKEIVYRGGFNLQHLLKGKPETTSEMFFGECLRTVMLLLNAVEDVRIDSICPPNLKKYIDKLDKRGAAHFVPHYNDGELDEDTLLNIVYRLLYHHKGFISDETIKNRFGDIDHILNSTPKEYTPGLLKAFKEEIRNHCESVYNDFDFSQEAAGGSEMDEYLQQVKESTNDQQFEKTIGSEKEFSDACVEGIKFEDKEISENRTQGEMKKKFHIQYEEAKELKLVPRSMKASIDVFKNVRVVDCHEQLYSSGYSDDEYQTIDYKTLIIG